MWSSLFKSFSHIYSSILIGFNIGTDYLLWYPMVDSYCIHIHSSIYVFISHIFLDSFFVVCWFWSYINHVYNMGINMYQTMSYFVGYHIYRIYLVQHVSNNYWSDPDLVKTLIFMYSGGTWHLIGRDGS